MSRTYNVLFLCTGNSSDAYHALKRRIELFLALPLESIDKMTLASRLREIGEAKDEEARLG